MRRLLPFALLLIVGVAWAQPWRYVDKRGNVHYTDDITQLPPKQRAAIEAKRKAKQADAGVPADAGAPPAEPGAAPTPPTAAPAPPTAAPAPPTAAPAPPTAPPPDAKLVERERWTRLLDEARTRVQDAEHRLSVARLEAEQAARNAVLMTTGPNLAARQRTADAEAAAQAALKAAIDAEAALRERARQAGYGR